MSDHLPSGPNQSRFDADSFQVEAIELPNTDLEYDDYTNLWAEYAGIESMNKMVTQITQLESALDILRTDGDNMQQSIYDALLEVGYYEGAN